MSHDPQLGGLAFERLEIVDAVPVSEDALQVAGPAAVADPAQGVVVERFDVLLAENLDPPRRHMQRYLWLETIAPSAQAAVRLALTWTAEDPRDIELTGMVRPAGLREPKLGDLDVNWSLPVERRTPPGAVVRHPTSGLRFGFVASRAAELRYLPPQAAGVFRLVTRKPTDTAQPVCLAPLVDLVGWA